MIFYVLNRDEEAVTAFDSENVIDYSVLKAEINSKLNDLSTLKMELFGDCVGAEYLIEENYIYFLDLEQQPQLYTIKKVVGKHSSDHIISIECEHGRQELLDEVCLYSIYGITLQPSVMLGQILAGTRWEVGEVDTVTTHPCTGVSLDKTVLEAVYNLADDYGLAVIFRLDGAHRYVDMKAVSSRDTGKRFEYSKDINSVQRTVDTTGIKTAVIPVGGSDEEPFDIGTITWTTPTNPLNKPAGQKYLEDPTATSIYGYKGTTGKRPRYLKYKDTGAKDATELINNAYIELQKYTSPKVTYELDVVDLYRLTGDSTFTHEKIQLGDLVAVIDHEFNPPLTLKAVVNEQTINLLAPTESTIKLGDVRETLTDVQNNQADKTVNLERDLNNAKASITNLDGQLQLKVEEGDVKTIIQQSPTDIKIGFNEISNAIVMSVDGITVNTSNGDKTTLSASGLLHISGATTRPYHYLSLTGVGLLTAGSASQWVQLPSEYQNKPFTASVAMGSIQNLTSGYGLQTFNVFVVAYDYANAKFQVQGYVNVFQVSDPTNRMDIDFQYSWTVTA
ncbi:phage tail protein [Clostridium felsineum]|uniref:phage tail protein n=1 Tax=Clostridium felsineum TaxID=36839 RepID=UPI00098C297D|nr:phage tail protein [Clostridium felsineum]URZ16855.1 hypothetical protein CLFE_029020 [Clostridium felsineum DSM 794]